MLIHSPVDEHLYYFQFVVLTDKTAIEIWAQVFVETCAFILLGVTLGVEWPGHIIGVCLPFLETAEHFFQGGCTILHSHPQSVRVSRTMGI